MASLAVIVVEIVVACVSLALTAAVISALQSMLVDVVVPVVVTVDALDVLVLAVLLVLELTDVTVLPDPSQGEPGRHHAGPEVVSKRLAEQLEQVLRHLVRRGFRRHRGLGLHFGRGQRGLLGRDIDVLDRRVRRLQVLGLGRDRVRR